jgi:hypothetical protein
MRTGDQRAERAQAKPERVRRGRGDTGAIIAEAALITPFFMFILFGILEFGGTFRDYLTLNNAVATASRKASVAANAPDADYGVVLTIRKEIGAMPLSQVQRIIIFHASGPNSAAPKTCLSGATGSAGSGSPLWTGACNVYTNGSPNWTTLTVTDFGCGSSPPAQDRSWCPTNRKYAAQGTFGPPDFVGIYIEIKHKYYTGMFGSDRTMSKTAIIQIEPQALGAAP